jgi:diphthamide biosynthesis protein 2
VAAEHANIEAVVHFGHHCGSSSATLPVLHVYAQSSFDVDAALAGLREKLVATCREQSSEKKKGFVVVCEPKYTGATG